MSNCNFFKIFGLIIFYSNFFGIPTIIAKENICYDAIYTYTNWTDTRPHFSVNMTFDERDGMSSQTRVRRVVQDPIATLAISLLEGRRTSTLYNVTARLCEVDAMMKRIPMMQQAFQMATKKGNFSFSCPMMPGLYVMQNVRISRHSPALVWLRPKTQFTFSGGLYAQMKNKTLLTLTTYNISMKVVKKRCR